MIFESKRLILRPWRESDAETLYKYASDPLVGPAAGWQAHPNVEHSLKIIRDVLSAEGTYAITLRGSNECIGSVGVFKSGACPGADEPEIGYWIGRPFWGQGLVPEAVRCLLDDCFSKPEVRRVWCCHFAGNDKSRRVIEKCGFRREFMREVAVPDMGERRIEYFYSIRAEEWKTKSSAQ